MPVISCRIAACRETPDADGNDWSFYLINDSADPLELAVLHEISYEWGDMPSTKRVDVRVAGLAPGAHAHIWRDDGELRMDLSLRVQARGRELKMWFEFPRLYRKQELPIVDGLGKPGYEVAAEGTCA